MPPERAFNEMADASSARAAGTPEEVAGELIDMIDGWPAHRYEGGDEWPKADHVSPYRCGPLYLDAIMQYARQYPVRPEMYRWTEPLVRERRMGIIIGVALACSVEGENWDYELDDTFMASLYEDVEQARNFLVHMGKSDG